MNIFNSGANLLRHLHLRLSRKKPSKQSEDVDESADHSLRDRNFARELRGEC